MWEESPLHMLLLLRCAFLISGPKINCRVQILLAVVRGLAGVWPWIGVHVREEDGCG